MAEENSFAVRRISFSARPISRAKPGSFSAPNRSNTAARTSRISGAPSELKINPVEQNLTAIGNITARREPGGWISARRHEHMFNGARPDWSRGRRFGGAAFQRQNQPLHGLFSAAKEFHRCVNF